MRFLAAILMLTVMPALSQTPAPKPQFEVASVKLDPRPSIFTALQEEFGLKLESRKGHVEVLVIDCVQKPSEN